MECQFSVEMVKGQGYHVPNHLSGIDVNFRVVDDALVARVPTAN